MYYVYILRSKKSGKLYTGFSSNLKSRIKQHFSGDVHTTFRMGKVELVFYEAYNNEIDARKREKYFKTTKGKRSLKIMLSETLSPHRLAA